MSARDDLAQELRDQAESTRRLIARLDFDRPGETGRALTTILKNEQAILEALALLLLGGADAPARAPSRAERRPRDPDGSPSSIAQISQTLNEGEGEGEGEGEAAAAPAAPPEKAESISGPRARRIVEEFDNRDKDFARGLDKLNSWLRGGAAGLPFQKRENHAYLNCAVSSGPMLQRIEVELMGREGYARRLGRLVIDGLEGEVVIYARSEST